MPSTTTHNLYSPSRLQRIHDCPGSVRMEAMCPPAEKTPDATEGTMLHERVESLLVALATQNIVEEDPRDYAFKGLDTEQQQAIESCVEFLKTLERDGDKIYTEYHVEVKDEHGELLTEGTLDVALIHADNTADIIDWKFGRTPVEEAPNNYQGASYSLAIFQRFNVSSVTFHIYQPRIFAHTQYTFTNPRNILTNIRNIINRAKAPELILNAGDTACRYCAAKSICPAFSARFRALEPTQNETSALADPAVLLDYWNRAQVVDRFLKELKEAVTSYCKEHGNLGEWYIQERAGRREITNSVELCTRLNSYITAAEWRACNTVNLGKLTDLIVEKLKAAATANGEKLTTKAAKEKVESLIGDLIQRGEPSSVLTRKAEK